MYKWQQPRRLEVLAHWSGIDIRCQFQDHGTLLVGKHVCFRGLYGTTIFEYVRKERFHRAKIMLEQGLSVTEASFAVGYESLASFSISFKKRFGYAPSRYFPKNTL